MCFHVQRRGWCGFVEALKLPHGDQLSPRSVFVSLKLRKRDHQLCLREDDSSTETTGNELRKNVHTVNTVISGLIFEQMNERVHPSVTVNVQTHRKALTITTG